jgi:hypothetical protein
MANIIPVSRLLRLSRRKPTGPVKPWRLNVILEGKIGERFREIMLAHFGHNLSIVTYGPAGDIHDVALECEDCGEVLIDSVVDVSHKLLKVRKLKGKRHASNK